MDLVPITMRHVNIRLPVDLIFAPVSRNLLDLCVKQVIYMVLLLRYTFYRIAGVVISVLDSSMVDMGSSTSRVLPTSMKLVFVLLRSADSTNDERTKTGLHGIRIMC